MKGKCYYFNDVRQSYEKAQSSCAEKFKPNLGRLFEPPSLDVNNAVLRASRPVVKGAINLFSIGVKRKTGENDFKYASSGAKVPFDLPWGYNMNRHFNTGYCVIARNGPQDLKWLNQSCDYPRYSICEPV